MREEPAQFLQFHTLAISQDTQSQWRPANNRLAVWSKWGICTNELQGLPSSEQASPAIKGHQARNVTSRQTKLSPIAETRFVTKKIPINHGTTHLAAQETTLLQRTATANMDSFQKLLAESVLTEDKVASCGVAWFDF